MLFKRIMLLVLSVVCSTGYEDAYISSDLCFSIGSQIGVMLGASLVCSSLSF